MAEQDQNQENKRKVAGSSGIAMGSDDAHRMRPGRAEQYEQDAEEQKVREEVHRKKLSDIKAREQARNLKKEEQEARIAEITEELENKKSRDDRLQKELDEIRKDQEKAKEEADKDNEEKQRLDDEYHREREQERNDKREKARKECEQYEQRAKEQKEKQDQQQAAKDREARRQQLLAFFRDACGNHNLQEPPFADEERYDYSIYEDDNGTNLDVRDKKSGTLLHVEQDKINVNFMTEADEKGFAGPMPLEAAEMTIQAAVAGGWNSLKTFGSEEDRKLLQIVAATYGIKVDNWIDLSQEEQAFYDDYKQRYEENQSAAKYEKDNTSDQEESDEPTAEDIENDADQQPDTEEPEPKANDNTPEQNGQKAEKTAEEFANNSPDLTIKDEAEEEPAPKADINSQYQKFEKDRADFAQAINSQYEELDRRISAIEDKSEIERLKKIEANQDTFNGANVCEKQRKIIEINKDIFTQIRKDLIKSKENNFNKNDAKRLDSYFEGALKHLDEGKPLPVPQHGETDENMLITAALFGYTNNGVNHLIEDNNTNESNKRIAIALLKFNENILYQGISDPKQEDLREDIFIATKGELYPLEKEDYTQYVQACVQAEDMKTLEDDISDMTNVADQAYNNKHDEALKRAQDVLATYQERFNENKENFSYDKFMTPELEDRLNAVLAYGQTEEPKKKKGITFNLF